MTTIDNRILHQLLELTSGQAAMRAEVSTFIRDQNTIRLDINAVRSDISELKSEVSQIKATDMRRKSFVGGIIAAISVVQTAVVVFVWPYIKEKLGF